MQVIISHINIDFDGLASLVAAKKLYPKAKIVLPEKISISVQQFLAIYRDSLDLHSPKQIDWSAITHVIMVDIANLERVGTFSNELKRENVHFTVYDHHQPNEFDITSNSGNIEFLGATVTMLIEEIIANNISITSFEATVMALGIYTDTGSFTYLGTTARDLKAASFLMENGANLAIVASFSDRPLLDTQQTILNSLLLNVTEYQSQGIEVLISWHRQKEYQGGLAILARKLLDITGSQAAFIVVEMAKKIFVVGRSSTDRVDVLPVITLFQGGGHTKAASATIKGGDCLEIVEQIKSMISTTIKPAITAIDMMTSPVKTISPETTIEDAAKMMLRYGHTGFPVLEEEKLVGIISRRDLDKATHHGLGHAPVKGFMSKEVITIAPDTTIEEIQNVMIEHNVGRMPVVEDEQLIGIISRTDVVEFLHGNAKKVLPIGEQIVEPVVTSIIDKMKKFIDIEIYQLLDKIGEKADLLGFKAYIIGGVVRDLIMENKNEDIDIVVEGDGIQFAELLAEELGGSVRGHQKFGTATWKLDPLCHKDKLVCKTNVKIDITTARREYYDYPAALPTVERSTLKEDLYRRDFTINAMAIQINHSEFGKLIDYFHGIQDIKKKRIRVLYNLSFVEDPTRILRAVRFEERFGFLMDSQTEELVHHSLDKLPAVSEVRIANELRILFQEKHPVEAIKRLASLGVWDYLIGEGVVGQDALHRVESLHAIYKKITEDSYEATIKDTKGKENRTWISYLLTLFYSFEDWYDRTHKFALNNEDIEVLDHIRNLELSFMDILSTSSELGGLHRFLHMYRLESIAFLIMTFEQRLEITPEYDQMIPVKSRKKILEVLIKYLQKRRTIPLLVSGRELSQIGVKPGPIYSVILFELQCAYLDGEVVTKEDGLNWVKSYISNGLAD